MLLFVIMIDRDNILEYRFSFSVPVAGQLWMTIEPLSVHCTVNSELLVQLCCHFAPHFNASKRINMLTVTADTVHTLYLNCRYYQLH